MTSSYDKNNIFAKLLRGDISSHRVYEDEHAVVIMDVMPQGRGHILVIPRHPARNLLDAPESQLQSLILIVQKMARAVKTALHADGVTIMQFNEAAGGQSVYHLHFHVIPRFDGVALKPHSGEMANSDELAAIAQEINAAL